MKNVIQNIDSSQHSKAVDCVLQGSKCNFSLFVDVLLSH